ncbi:hypothetical protein YH63_015665 [Afipia massiliensis]|uniref:Uncharacterized protein n=1 Tax=Afipia massiliensis TaxID=211460 RepID=A0A4U6BQI7_9BRAD|nr:hypothetical protein [Afipia massiliensis]TKT72747.1 hypothetical protein YH63_015665 [Afipia massiliensis]
MKAFCAAVVLAGAMLGAGAAQAMPIASLAAAARGDVVAVKDGCGVGFHRLSSGVCRPQPEGPRLMRLFARKCQVGYRRNLAGKCRRE